jgi:hypothetical protein
LREASLRLRAHYRVGAGDDDGRFLRQEVETESEKQKNPKSPKTKNKSIKQTEKRKANKMPL